MSEFGARAEPGPLPGSVAVTLDAAARNRLVLILEEVVEGDATDATGVAFCQVIVDLLEAGAGHEVDAPALIAARNRGDEPGSVRT